MLYGAALVALLVCGWLRWSSPGSRPGSHAVAAGSAGPAPQAVAGSWRPGPELQSQRSEVAAANAAGTLYVLGGLTEGGTLNTVEALPPGAGAWEMRAPLPEP